MQLKIEVNAILWQIILKAFCVLANGKTVLCLSFDGKLLCRRIIWSLLLHLLREASCLQKISYSTIKKRKKQTKTISVTDCPPNIKLQNLDIMGVTDLTLQIPVTSCKQPQFWLSWTTSIIWKISNIIVYHYIFSRAYINNLNRLEPREMFWQAFC